MKQVKHDRESIHQLVERNKDTVYKMAIIYCKSKSDADDVFQEVFLRYCKKQPIFYSEEHEKAWFIRVTINCCKSLLKSAWFQKTTALEDIYPAVSKEDKGLSQYIRRLPQNYRLVIYLHYYEGYSLVEVAELLGKNENTVRTNLFRAKAKLKDLLEKEEYVWNAD